MQKKILIVDGDPEARSVLRAYFLSLGWDVIETGSAVQAAMMSDGHRPDLIVMDIVASGVMCGKATRLLTENRAGSETQLIIACGLADSDRIAGALRARYPHARFLKKPFDLAALCGIVGAMAPTGGSRASQPSVAAAA